jgi:hypothetical protein
MQNHYQCQTSAFDLTQRFAGWGSNDLREDRFMLPILSSDTKKKFSANPEAVLGSMTLAAQSEVGILK